MAYFAATVGVVSKVQVSGISDDFTPWGTVVTETGHTEAGFFRYVGGITDQVFFAAGSGANDDVDIYISFNEEATTFFVDTTISGQRSFPSAAATNVFDFNYELFIGSSPPSDSPQIWRRTSFSVWSNVHSFGSDRREILALKRFNGFLYAAVSGVLFGNDAEIWKTSNGTTWSLVTSFPGFIHITALEVYNGDLYTAIWVAAYEGAASDAREIWSTVGGSDATWVQAYAIPTSGSPLNTYVTTQMTVHIGKNRLFVGTGQETAGGPIYPEVYTFDGVAWSESISFAEDVVNDANGSPVSLDTRNTVTALGYDPAFDRVYAATGSFAAPQFGGVRIYTWPTPNLIDMGGG